MKKIITFLVLCTLSIFLLTNTKVSAGVLPEDQPLIGVEDQASDYYSHWQQGSFGGSRITDTGVVMAMTSGFGLRSGFRTPYNVSDFEMSLDLTHMDPGVALATFFGPQGCYISGNGATLSIDILKHNSEAHKYLVAIQAGSGVHHVGFEELTVPEQGNWEDPAWIGYHVVAEDDVITIHLLDQGENTKVTINGRDFTIATEKLYKDVENKTSTYFLLGTMNKEGSVQTITANYILDANRRAYHSENGAYYEFKASLKALEAALLKDLSVQENITAAQEIRDQMDESNLFEFDRKYLSPRYTTAYTLLNEAIKELGGDIVINVFETELVKFENAAEKITNLSTANTALNLKTSSNNKLLAIDEDSLTEEQVDKLNDLKARLIAANTLVDEKIIGLVQDQINEYVLAVADLTTVEKVNAALKLKEAISLQLINLLTEEDKTTYNNQIKDANNALVNATSELENWLLGERTYILSEEDVISATFLGSALGSSGNGIFYTKEKFDVRNFKMTISPLSLSTNAGGWFSFGIMEKAEIFSNAEDSSVQDNKGIFFLVIPQGSGKAKVEIYQMSLYCNRFFDAQKTEYLTIDITKDIEVVFGTEIKVISGVSEEYMTISIGGQKMVSDLITTRGMKTSLADYTGYLYLAGQGSTINNVTSIKIKSINGNNPLDSTLFAAYTPEPLSSTTSVDYELESLNNVEINLDTRGLTINSVTIDGTALAASDYTYLSNKLTIKSEVLENLSLGKKEVVIITDGGEVHVELQVTEAQVTPTKSIFTPTILIVIVSVMVLAIGGVGFIIIKKKNVE